MAIIVIPSLVVLTFYFWNHQEVANQWPLPEIPVWTIPLAVVAIALLNGLREELYFRFILLNHLAPHEKIVALISSSILFGFIHYQNGFPQGWLGVILTTIFGLAVGLQYFYYRSASLTWLTHSLADGAMFAIILLTKK